MAGAIEIKDRNSNVRLALNAQGSAFVDNIPGQTLDISTTSPIDVQGTVSVETVTPIDVQGTVTATPSGTQTVDGTVDVGNTVTVTAITPLPVTLSSGTIQGGYGFSETLATGSSTAKNFVAIFNPLASLVNLRMTGAFVSCGVVSGGTSNNLEPMRAYRITTSTGGTLEAAADVFKFQTAYPNASAEVRTGNPSVTLGAAISNSPPAVNSGPAQTVVHQVTQPDEPPLVLIPGEGIVFRTEGGDTDQRWNIAITWTESLIV